MTIETINGVMNVADDALVTILNRKGEQVTMEAEDVFGHLCRETYTMLDYMPESVAVATVSRIPGGGMGAVLHAFGKGGSSDRAQAIWDAMSNDCEIKGEIAMDYLWYLYEKENYTWQDFERGHKL